MKKIIGFSLLATLTMMANSCQPCNCPTCPAAAPEKTPAGACSLGKVEKGMSVTVDGEVITLDNIGEMAKNELANAEKEHKNRLYNIKVAALEDAIEMKLMANEAKRRNITLEELQKVEVVDKIVPPTDEEIQAVFVGSGAAEQGYTLDMVKQQIAMYLSQQQVEKIHSELLKGLKEKSKVVYDIPLPPAERKTLSLGDLSAWGDASKAKVVVVEYSDFQCPFCSRGAKVVDEAMKGYGPEVLRVFKHFPLPMHDQAKLAAQAAVCAQRQGKFWAAHEQLFAHQTELNADTIRGYMKDIGLDEAKYNDCMSDATVANLVEQDMASGDAAGVEGTPTIYVNGLEIVGMQSADMLRNYIDQELKAAK